jgi:hypothetical protein
VDLGRYWFWDDLRGRIAAVRRKCQITASAKARQGRTRERTRCRERAIRTPALPKAESLAGTIGQPTAARMAPMR